MADEMEAPDNIHSIHPSLAQLGGKVTQAKQGLDDTKVDKNYTKKRVKTAKNLLSEDLSTFKNKGEKMFKVLYDGIGLYEDKELQDETFTIMLEKDSIIPGTYIDNKTVLFGDPYNVYCSAINVEPTDITHSEYKDNKHEYDQTVIINVTDFDQLQPENNDEDANASSDYVVVDDNENENENAKNNNSSAATSEFEQINASDAQNSYENIDQNDNIQSHEPIISVMQVPQPAPNNNVPTVPPTPPTPPIEHEYEYEEEEDIDELSGLLGGSNKGALSGMPPPPTSPSQSLRVHSNNTYQNINPNQQQIPPPVPSDAVMINNNYNNNNYEEEEMKIKTKGHVENIGDRMSMDDIKLVDDSIVASTGNLLEDLDNLLRIYRNLSDDKERELVYKEFWNKYEIMCTDKPYLLLNIPCRVRGFLHIMNGDGDGIIDKMEIYKQDRIMMHVLSRNGLLQEPDYIINRYLYTYFIQVEIFNYAKWFCTNCAGIQSWMFFLLWILMLAEIIHIGIDFGRGNPWRAILMECLVPLTFIASIQFVNTPFTSNILRPLLENKCAALCTIYGRVSLNVLVIFFCLGSIEIGDIFLLFAAFLCAVWTCVIFICFSRLKHAANYVRIATGRVDKLKEKFMIANDSKDGILTHLQLRQFFKSYNQIVPLWQIDLMISQYDIHRDNGLRFDALKIWFEKIPVNHLTRINLLNTQSTFDGNNNNIGTNTGGGGGGAMQSNQEYQTTTTGQVVMQSNQEPQYTEAEKEWLGLAGKKYMNK